MISQKCPNCGGPVQSKTTTCAYCGCRLVDDSVKVKANQNFDVSPEIVSQTIISNPIVSSSNIIVMLIPLIFIFCWTAGVWGMSGIIGSSGMFGVEMVPLLMGVIGFALFCVILGFFIKQLYTKSIQDKYLELIKANKFDEAYELGKDKKDFNAYQILIAHYIKKDYELSKSLCLTFPSISSQKITQSQIFIKIFEEFQLTPPKYVVQNKRSSE